LPHHEPMIRSGSRAILPFDPRRLENSTTLLYNDLLRHGDEAISLARRATGFGDADIPILATVRGGKRYVLALSGPLTPDHPADAKLKKICEEAKLPLLVANELVPSCVS
jgi:hypothetical protein